MTGFFERTSSSSKWLAPEAHQVARLSWRREALAFVLELKRFSEGVAGEVAGVVDKQQISLGTLGSWEVAGAAVSPSAASVFESLDPRALHRVAAVRVSRLGRAGAPAVALRSVYAVDIVAQGT